MLPLGCSLPSARANTIVVGSAGLGTDQDRNNGSQDGSSDLGKIGGRWNPLTATASALRSIPDGATQLTIG